jgi:murein DD-endopeptidase MepM/ murein hydrolase activator NlpD
MLHGRVTRCTEDELLVLPDHFRTSTSIPGFLSTNRRVLTLGALAVAGLLTSIPSLPARADAFLPAVEVVPAQSLAPALDAVSAPIARDAFGISTYSVVQWPVPATTPVSSGFGYRECDGCTTDHKGTDFNPGGGYPIQSIADGVVTDAGWDSTGYGFMVTVEHVIDGQTVTSLYAHMLEGSIAVSVGQTISRGEVLGLVGSTGEATGAHLHFGLLFGDEFVDPYPWLLEHANA